MVHLDFVQPPARPMPLARLLAQRAAHVQQMILAALIASGTIILVAAAIMVAV
jgi:hypothetical protein